MWGLQYLKSRDKNLDRLVREIENDMANNYKDAAQEAFKELIGGFKRMSEENKLNKRQKAYYSDLIESFKHKLEGYSHKDQKPFWTR